MPKPSKSRTTKQSKKRAPTADREPEVLGADDAGVDEVLDLLAHVLERSDGKAAPARKAITAAFGGSCDAAREVEVLKRVKRDARFRIVSGRAGASNRIELVTAGEAAESPANNPPADPTPPPAAAAPTLGDHVAAAGARAQHIPWKHDVGSSVMLLTDGHPPRRAVIRNIAEHGTYALYDLSHDNGAQTNEVPAYRIGRDLDAEGEMAQLRQHCALIERHLERGKTMAQKYVEMQAEERKLADHLSKFRKSIDEMASKIAEHNRTDPGQMELEDAMRAAEAARPPRAERMEGEPEAGEDVLDDHALARFEGLEAITMEDAELTLHDLYAARIEQATASTGKPQKVKPVLLGGGPRVVTDVQEGHAVTLPIVDGAGWAFRYLTTFGAVLELPSEAQSETLAKGGRLCGMPVKVGRKTMWIGPEFDAVLVRLPAEEPKAVGKDAAAGG